MAYDDTIDVSLRELMDLDGLRYIGAPIPAAAVAPYLDLLGRHVGAARAAELSACKARRDGADSFHVTAVTPPQLCGDVDRKWNDIVWHGKPVTLHLYGIGAVRHEEAVSYFIVAESPEIQALREQTGLPPANLHVTLGFTPHDIYHLAKDRNALISVPEER
jgi:hypothetical protein